MGQDWVLAWAPQVTPTTKQFYNYRWKSYNFLIHLHCHWRKILWQKVHNPVVSNLEWKIFIDKFQQLCFSEFFQISWKYLVNPTVGGAAQDIFNKLLVNLIERPGHDDTDSEAGDHEDNQSVEDWDRGEDGNADKPEPEEDIDLLVDDVEGKNAEAVMSGDCSGGSIFVKCAFCYLG